LCRPPARGYVSPTARAAGGGDFDGAVRNARFSKAFSGVGTADRVDFSLEPRGELEVDDAGF
jgi:hypothetical protein